MLENIPVIVCNCNFHLTKSSVVFFLRLFFLHKGFNLVWITHQILGKNLASVLCNQDIILDPGFGFGKTLEHNYELMAHLEEFHIFELPVLVGVSRKSMIYKLLGGTPQDSLNGTTILDTVALMKGAHILRVHDVREAVETVRIVEKIKKESHVF